MIRKEKSTTQRRFCEQPSRIQEEREKAMTDDMSTPYLLTLIGDRIEDLGQMIIKLKTQDKEHTAWGEKGMDTLKQGLIWIKAKVDERLDEVLKNKGKDPASYTK